MLEYSSSRFGNKFRRVDIHDIWINDRLATDLTEAELRAVLKEMKCPYESECSAKPDLLFALGCAQQEAREARRAAAAAGPKLTTSGV